MEIVKFIKNYQNFFIVIFTFFSGIFSFYILKLSNSIDAVFILKLFYWSLLFEIFTIFLDEALIKTKLIYFYYNKQFIVFSFIIIIFLIIYLKAFSFKKIFVIVIYSLVQLYYIFLRSVFRFKKNINLFKVYFSLRNVGAAIIFYFIPVMESYIGFILLYTIIINYKYKTYLKFKYFSMSFSFFLLGMFYALLGGIRVIIPINYFIQLPKEISVLYLLKFSIFNNLYNIFIGYLDSTFYNKKSFFLKNKNLVFYVLGFFFIIILGYVFLYFFIDFFCFDKIFFKYNFGFFYQIFHIYDIILFDLALILGFFQIFFYINRKYVLSVIFSFLNIIIWSIWFVYV